MTEEGSVCWRAGRAGRRMEMRIVLAWAVVVLGGKPRAAPADWRFAKATFCEFSLLSDPQEKKEMANVTMLTLVALSRHMGMRLREAHGDTTHLDV